MNKAIQKLMFWFVTVDLFVYTYVCDYVEEGSLVMVTQFDKLISNMILIILLVKT